MITEEEQFMSYTKPKPKKDSLLNFNKVLGTEEQRINFFIKAKYPDGFECDKCGCNEYYLIKRKGIRNQYILQCKDCGKQVSILDGTIFSNSKLTLYQILIGLFLFIISNKGISGPDLANAMDVCTKTAQRYIRRFRTMMAENNNQKVLDAMYYEIDIIEYGGVEHGGKRGKGADKAQVFMALSTDAYNKYPRYMMLHFLPDHKAGPIKKFVSKHMVLSSDTIVSCDNDSSFKWLKNVVDLNNAKVDYSDDDHKLYWLNVIASNFENNLKNIYRRITKRDLPLFLAEQTYRFNHRYTGKNFISKMCKYIGASSPITNKQFTRTLDAYAEYFEF